jgi:hypothetical protein
VREVERDAPASRTPRLEGLEDPLLLLRAHPFHRADALLLRGDLERLERVDSERLPEEPGRLRPHAVERGQREQARRNFFAQRLVRLARAGRADVADARREVFPYPGKICERAPFRERGDVLGQPGEGLRGAAISPYLERILVRELEKIRDAVQDPCNFQVLQTRGSDTNERRPTTVLLLGCFT